MTISALLSHTQSGGLFWTFQTLSRQITIARGVQSVKLASLAAKRILLFNQIDLIF